MRHRGVLVLAGLAGALALLVSLSVATAGGARKQVASVTAAAAVKPPAVPNKKALKRKYGGQKITFIGDSVGWGSSTTNTFVEGTPTAAPATTAAPGTSAARLPNGHDTNANSTDFGAASPPTPKASNS